MSFRLSVYSVVYLWIHQEKMKMTDPKYFVLIRLLS